HNSSNGILGRSNAGFKVQNTRIQDNARVGIFALDGSNAEINDCTISHNGDDGVGIFNNSFAVFKGSVTAIDNKAGAFAGSNSSVEVRGGSLEASSNRSNGIEVDTSIFRINNLDVSLGSSITATGNGANGIFLGGSLFGVSGGPAANHVITAMNNSGSGIFIPGASVLLNARPDGGG